jgi:hypothetical protein
MAETIREGIRMTDMAEISHTPLISNQKTFGQRLLPACFLGTIMVAMAGCGGSGMWSWES